MSYARWTEDSEVYVFQIEGGFECHFCKQNNGDHMDFKTRSDLKEHLLDHRKQGDMVPEYALETIEQEMKRYDGY
jgi:hypothetical protein